MNKQGIHSVQEKIIRFGIDSHTYFDKEIWQKSALPIRIQSIAPSYHNEHHIMAILKAIDIIFFEIQRGHDAFGILSETRKFIDEIDEEYSLSITEIKIAFQLAFVMHDLGNIVHSDKVEMREGKLVLDYSSQYDWVSGNTEIKSCVIANRILTYYDHEWKHLFKNNADLVYELVFSIIKQTIIKLDKRAKKPLWHVVQIIDQIASYYYSDVSIGVMTAGFMNELYVEGYKDLKINTFVGFIPHQLSVLIPKEKVRNEIILFFEKTRSSMSISPIEWSKKYLLKDDRDVQFKSDIEWLIGL
ncbi:MAG: hypothetical protein WCO06_01125 [Candidatus Roizmanbacteria bacterium]